MATASDAWAVKSLNSEWCIPAKRKKRNTEEFSDAEEDYSKHKEKKVKRFVFEKFSQRKAKVHVDVYQSLDPQKAEPSEGSTFFRDCLIEYRELNTAEDFINFYEEMFPLVQTLPLIILQKDKIISELLKRLSVDKRLSYTPILRLIAALANDLLEDYIPFLESVSDGLGRLLESGADKDPETVEEIFTSWSYIMMYLKKYLTKDVAHVLRVTAKIRYYAKDYVRDQMARSVSFILRNASMQQLKKGIRKVMIEVVEEPSDIRKSGAAILLSHTVRITPSKLHSNAESLIRLLLDDSFFDVGDENIEGPVIVVEVLLLALQQLYANLDSPGCTSIRNWLCLKMSGYGTNGNTLHLPHLLSLLIATLRNDRQFKISDHLNVVELAGNLMQNFVIPYHGKEITDQQSEVINNVLELMLCILDGLSNFSNRQILIDVGSKWRPIFNLQSKSLVAFIGDLLKKDHCIFYVFEPYIMSALNNLIGKFEEDAVHLLLCVCEKLGGKKFNFVGTNSKELPRACTFSKEALCYWIGKIKEAAVERNIIPTEFQPNKLAVLWGVLGCYANFEDGQVNPSLLMDLINAIDELLIVQSKFAAFPEETWLCLIGAALRSHHKLAFRRNTTHDESALTRFLDLAKRYKSSPQILSAVADTLDLIYGSEIKAADAKHQIYLPELVAGNLVDAITTFTDNLCHANKEIRLSTLRILCHYEPLRCDALENDIPAAKQTVNVFNILRSIEAAPLSVTGSHVSLISKMELSLNGHRVPEQYMPIVLSGIIGILHNRFRNMWDPALKCLEVILGQYTKLLWEKFMEYLGQFQSAFLSSLEGQLGDNDDDGETNEETDLVVRFNSNVRPSSDNNPIATVLSLLIQSLQRVPSVVDSHSRKVVPLFLKFLGYNGDQPDSVGARAMVPKGKEWRSILKDWLNLFRLLHNPRSFYQSQFLKDVLQYRLLDENDADLQMKVLDCLLNWKDDSLIPYSENLKNLVNVKCVRDEITRWSLSRESNNAIDVRHRRHVVPIVIRVLVPKVRNMKMLGSQKNVSAQHRRAVLGFLSQLDVDELPLLFSLLTKPLLLGSLVDDETSQSVWMSSGSPTDILSNVLNLFTVDTVKSLSWKKVCGFLHVIEDILAVFDEAHLNPFFNLLMNCIARILASCTSSLDITNAESLSSSENYLSSTVNNGEQDKDTEDGVTAGMNTKQSKDLAILCFRIIYGVISKYEDRDFGNEFWQLFFASVRPLIDQEGAKEDAPKLYYLDLFQCFLAMSKSHKLAPLLLTEGNLVRDIFHLLTVEGLSQERLTCALKFSKNLLQLDSELGSEGNAAKDLLLPHLNVLVKTFVDGKGSRSKIIKRDFTLFKLLSAYVKEPQEAESFIGLLLPVLTKKNLNPDTSVEILRIIQQLLTLAGSTHSKNILRSLSPLLISAGLEVRTSICAVLDTLAASDASVVTVAKILTDLNATEEMEIDDLDYDKVIGAYNKINVEFFYSVPEEQALLILAHSIYDLSSKVVRQSAAGVLRSFIQFSGLILNGQIKSGTPWTESITEHIVEKFLLKQMGYAMEKESSVLQVWFDILKEMVLKIPRVANLGSFLPLCSDDPEQDFFKNLFHLQKHMRARALSRFKKVMEAGSQSEVVSDKVFVPLLFRLLFELQDGKDENIRSACMETLAFISGNMDWDRYCALLNKCFRELKLKPDKQKILLRLIHSVLDKYHFSEVSSVHAGKSSNNVDHDPYNIDVASSSTLHRCSNSTELPENQKYLQENLLPKIRDLLTSDTDKINVKASLVALKLLKLLPAEIMDSQLPTIIHRIANFLKHRLESVRQDARSALFECLKELGLEYLQFIVKVLKGILKRGFELHVLGYTLNFILSKALTSPICGKLDYCLQDLLSVVENDILGGVAEEKDVDKIASKMKETRKQKSYETLKLITQSITFKTHAVKLLSAVTNHLQKQLTQKVKTKLENMLSHIAAGIECNPSVDRTELFVFVYGLIEDGVADEVDEHANTNSDGNSSIPSNQLIRVDRRFSHLITAFSLGVMHNYMKKLKFNKEDGQLLSLLDPFVQKLGQCLSSRYESVVTGALRCLVPLVRLPLPSLPSQGDKIKNSLLVIAQDSVNANQLTESCIKLLTTLLRSTRVTLSTKQLNMLIQFPLFVDLAKSPSGVALSLLKAIVQRKLVVPEIYDIVQVVAELMVKSQVEQIRKKSSEILLQFLLGYHLSEKRLQQHLDFLLANLRYEHPTGRESVLEMLHVIIKKLPRNVIDAQSQTMFVHLVVALANDEDSKVRSMTTVALKCLISHVSANSLQSILEYSQSWYFGAKHNLWGAAAQVISLLVEVMGKAFRKHLDDVLQAMRRILQSAVSDLRGEQLILSDDAVVPLWKEAYYSLVMFDKILHQYNNLFCEKDLEDVWDMICQFLLHPHLWLRNISNQILYKYFAAVTDASREKQESSKERFSLIQPSKLFFIAVSLFNKLKVPLIDDTARTIVLQNLMFSICELHSVLERNESVDAVMFWSNLESGEQDIFVKAFNVLDCKKGKRTLGFLTSEHGHYDRHQHPFVSHMLQRVGKTCFEMEASQMKIVFSCFKLIAPKLLGCNSTSEPPADVDLSSYAYLMLLPLYRVQEGYTGSVITDDLKQVAQEVSESIRDIIGVQNFVQINNQIRKNLKVKRDKRKQGDKIMAVVDPARNAKRKLRIAKKHQVNKKRKIISMKMGRWVR